MVLVLSHNGVSLSSSAAGFSRSSHLRGVGVRRHADAGGVALGSSSGEPLVELLGDEGHQGGQKAQADL